MDYEIADFNGSDLILGEGEPAERWSELAEVLDSMPVCLQASDQAGKVGAAIFDPKATNQRLTALAKDRGWHAIPVPEELTMFGNDWDAGKGSVLAEWQFSNYPFLWNNVLRTETVIKGKVPLPKMESTSALVVVTKGGEFPASNSTLYFEQARAQLAAVFKHEALTLPVRLVGLALPNENAVKTTWTTYGARYGRHGNAKEQWFSIYRGKARKYGIQTTTLAPIDAP